MTKRMLIDAAHREETRVVVADGTQIDEFDFESEAKKQIKGNIYLARITRVEPSLQAAFIEYGGNRHGFLAFSEIHPDYYQIPVADRERLLKLQAEAEAKRAAAQSAEDDAEAEEAEDTDEDAQEDDVEENGQSDGAEDASETEAQSEPAKNGEDEEASNGGVMQLASVQAEVLEIEDPALDGESWNDGEEDLELSDPTSEYLDEDGGDDDADAEEAGEDPEASEDDDRPRRGRRRGRRGGRRRTQAQETTRPTGRRQRGDRQSRGRQANGRPANGRPANGRRRNRRDDDEMDDLDRDPRPFFKNYKIQEVIRRRQVLLVQVVKEERGNKGAALTTYLSLAGRYCVLMPNTARGGGISRKITNLSDRRRLKSIVSEFDVPKGMGLIVRTAGANRTKAEVRRDYDYLIRLWGTVRDLTLKSSAPSMIYEEGNLIKRSIRDLYSKDIEEVLVEGKDAYKEAKAFMRMLMPSHARNVKLYTERMPLYQRYQVDVQLDSMLNPRVDLPSGGYIVLNQTEALVSVDVNSGKATREQNIENTALKTNLEAATEMARQLRLRDLAGLIVIDFIDMEENRNNRAVERRLKNCLENDRARLQVGRISNFGLLEMSRQRLRAGILEGSTRPCPHCDGAGIVRSVESAALRILRACGEEGVRERSAAVTVRTNRETAEYILNFKRHQLVDFEDLYGMKTIVTVDPALLGDDYEIDRGEPLSEARKRELHENGSVSLDTAYLAEEEAADEAAAAKAAEEEAAQEPAEETANAVDAKGTETVKDKDEDDQSPRRRRRGRRGGRRNRSRRDLTDSPGAEAEATANQAEGAEPASRDAEPSDAADEKPKRKRASRPRRRRSPAKEVAETSVAASGAKSKNGGESSAPREKETVAAEPGPAPALQGEDAKKGWWQKRWFN